MLGPGVLADVPIGIQRIMLRLQNWIIHRIAQGILNYNRITSSGEYLITTLAETDIFNRDLKKEIQNILNLSDKEINDLYNEAAQANYIYDKRAFEVNGIPFVPYADNYFVQQFARGVIENTQGTMRNITQSLGFAVRTQKGLQFTKVGQFYQQELDFAMSKIATGVQSFDEALKESVSRMADNGVRYVDYSTGYRDRIDVAARRAVMGGMRDLTNLQSDYNSRLTGSTVFEVSWHSGHRPSHMWGGRRFDVTGQLYPTELQMYEKYTAPNGEQGTLDDYNCYHEKYNVFSDSLPTFSDEELTRLEANELKLKYFEDKPYTAYQARQQQRYLERTMRRQQSVIAGLEGGEQEEALQNAKIKFNGLVGHYRAFSDAMGIPAELERVYTGFVA